MVGGGPAGSATAIVLARAGARVVLLEGSGYEGARVGETLPPDVRVPLDRLGAWARFQAAGHAPSPGIVAVWGGPEPHENDFIRSPYGSGWILDRARFDELLATVARDAGAEVRRHARVRRCDADGAHGWRLVLDDGDDRPVRAATVVDATGRSSRLRRQLGGRRVVHDHLVGLLQVLDRRPGADRAYCPPGAERAYCPPGAERADRRACIEATEHGWWYSAGLPDGRLVVAFYTDAAPGSRRGWDDLLACAPRTAARIGAPVGAAGRRRVAANSQGADPVTGPGWLAVGDAAAAHDPITGLGVYWALESGMAAAGAMLAGDSQAFADYGRACAEQFQHYLDQRAMYYRAEQRWPDAPFWRRRHTR